MRRGMAIAFATVGILVLASFVLIALEGPGVDDGPARTLLLITPVRTIGIGVDSTSRTLGELLEGRGVVQETASYRAYTERGEVQRIQWGTSVHWEDGKPRLDDGTALIGVAAEEGGRTGTLMSIAPSVLSSLNITHSLKEPPLSRVQMERVVVLELDGLGWDLVRGREDVLPNITRLGNLSSSLTAFPPRTLTGTAMALTGHDMLHNGVLTADDRALTRPTFLELADLSGRSSVWIEGDRSILSSDAELNVDRNDDGSVDDEIIGSLLDHLEGGTEVALAHFHSIDDEFHAGGSGAVRLSDAMSRVDSYVGQVVEHLEASPTPTLLILFSDHGLHDTEGGLGEHGSFRHEDMYAFTAFKAFGATMEGSRPTISLVQDGAVIDSFDIEGMEALPFKEGNLNVRSSRGETTSLFRGVLVRDLIELTSGKTSVTSLTFTSRDGLSISLPVEWTDDGEMTMLAYMKDGAPLPEGEGPFRLVVPQDLAGEYNGQYCLKDVASMEVAL